MVCLRPTVFRRVVSLLSQHSLYRTNRSNIAGLEIICKRLLSSGKPDGPPKVLVHPWGYDKDYGPATWAKNYPAAGGQKQSPIDIHTAACKYDQSLKGATFTFNYHPKDCVSLINPGQTWRVDSGPSSTSILRTSFLSGEEFHFQQAHAHWGSGAHNGSEHTVNGSGFASEVHIVHYNTKYGSFQEGLKHPDGLLVVGIFMNEGDHNEAFEPIASLLGKISYKTDKVALPNGYDLRGLVPDNKDFWTYHGSLTTPPCNECITWVVFKNTIPISRSQLERLRGMHTVAAEDAEFDEKITCNVRPTQPVHDRVVRASFQ